MFSQTHLPHVERLRLHEGDCIDALRQLRDSCVHAVVCDPPYGIGFMGRDWDHPDNVAFRADTWREVLRVLKPGGYLLAFSAARTYHRMAVAAEDAGFEIRDCLMWVYGSGFPKNQNVSAAIDKRLGRTRRVIGVKPGHDNFLRNTNPGFRGRGEDRPWMHDPKKLLAYHMLTEPASDEAREWDGWGTAIKPAYEPILMARKPLSEKTVAANVLRWGTGAINVDGCRVGTHVNTTPSGANRLNARNAELGYREKTYQKETLAPTQRVPGRFPANVVHDGSPEVVALFPIANSARASGNPNNPRRGAKHTATSYGQGDNAVTHDYRDSGSAARFFYCAKATKADRAGSRHPTVKPVKLMQWLVRMVTPPDGIVLDPFAGSGTTGEAARREGVRCVLIERDPVSARDIRHRFGQQIAALQLGGPREPDARTNRAVERVHGRTPHKRTVRRLQRSAG